MSSTGEEDDEAPTALGPHRVVQVGLIATIDEAIDDR